MTCVRERSRRYYRANRERVIARVIANRGEKWRLARGRLSRVSKSGLLVEAFGGSPLEVGEEDGAEFGEFGRRVVERVEHEGAFGDAEGEDAGAVVEGLLKPVGELLGGGFPDEGGELFDGLCGDGKAGELHGGEAT